MYRRLPPPGRFGGRFVEGHHPGWELLAHLLWLLVVAAVIVAAVVIATRLIRRSAPPAVGPAPAPTMGDRWPGGDRAAEELRLRYARGDISRDDYLRAAADLGVRVPATAATDASPPAAG